MKLPDWYKIKGYYHISSPSKVERKNVLRTIKKVTNKDFVASYGFFPLLHTNIKERKYKKHPQNSNVRVHSYYDNQDKKYVRTEKVRPLHYANHKDALIFAYYAQQLQKNYDSRLNIIADLSNCITAYRKIPVAGTDKNKGTIHFAHEAFSEIRRRVLENGQTGVLTFDIKSFFPSLNHDYLEKKWIQVMGFSEMPDDHKAVFKAATRFSFIYKDDLRKKQGKKYFEGRRQNFDEKKLALIGKKNGSNAFFLSVKEFREEVKKGSVRIYPNSFRNNKKEMIGIPQGLPISAVLANLYLLDFDTTVFQDLVKSHGCYYRRYSDDIVLICDVQIMDKVEEIVEREMNKCLVTLSKQKTEKYVFKKTVTGEILSEKFTSSGKREGLPFTYLGFEFYGDKTLIKSANLAKFYRRMIYSIKSKSQIAKKVGERNDTRPILYKRQLFKIYRNINLDKSIRVRRFKRYIQNPDTGEYKLNTEEFNEKYRGNYISYAKRAAEILNEPAILKQISGEQRVFNQAIQKHFGSK